MINKKNLQQIVKNYIDNFEFINSPGKDEYYKWQICTAFKAAADEMLSCDPSEVAQKLLAMRKASFNIIDSYTQPLSGFSAIINEPDIDDEESIFRAKYIQQMFKALYEDDGGDINVQMQHIEAFFNSSYELLKRSKKYSDSYLYKQNSHSVSSYLFLYNPDKYYMYKATESKAMARYLDYYGDFGTGDNVNLHEYYSMCDEIISELKAYPELLATNQKRYSSDFIAMPGAPFHADSQLHILLFDIMYCCFNKAYKLAEGITFTKLSKKEVNVIKERRQKALDFQARVEKMKMEYDALIEAKAQIQSLVKPGMIVRHKYWGPGTIVNVRGESFSATFNGDSEKTLSIFKHIKPGIISFEDANLNDIIIRLIPSIDEIQLINDMDRAAKEYNEYEQYL